MAYTKDQVINRVSTALHDTGTAIYGTAEIGQEIDNGLVEMATYKPYVVLATATPSAGTPELDISGVSDLLYGYSEDSFDAVEFQVDKVPRRFRNFTVRQSTLTMDISFSPDGSDEARLYCNKPHILGGSGTTSLNPETQRLLIDLVAARLSINQGMKLINQTDTAIAVLSTVATAIGLVNAQVTAATAYLATALSQVDLAPPLILKASTAIGKATAQIGTATANLISGTAYIDVVSTGDDPEIDWIQYVSQRLGVANSYFGEANGFLNLAVGDEAASQAYSNLATHRLSVATTELNKAGGYLNSITSRLSIAGRSNLNQQWGERKLAMTLNHLERIKDRKISERWPVVV